MSLYTTVLIADSQPSGHHAVRAAALNRETTLVVSHPDQLRGQVLGHDVEVRSVAERMKAGVWEQIQQQLRICQASAPDLNEATIAEFAADLTAAVDGRLQDALHSGEAPALLVATVLDKLAEQVVHARNSRFNARLLAALSKQAVVDLPERIRNYRRDDTVVRIGPRYGTVLLVDALAHGPALMEGLILHVDSTLVVSLPSHLDDVALLDDVEVIDRTVAMPAMCRKEIDERLERCKQAV